jgi:hypothetical protein
MINQSVREFDFKLPVGFTDEDGRHHRNATLRKMTGHEEALLADRKLRQNGGLLVTHLVSSCLRKLGDLQPVPRQVVSHLSSPDRNYLLLELRKITFGHEMEAGYRCLHCGDTTHLLQDLDELPVRYAEDAAPGEIVVELEDGYVDKGGEVYSSMIFRLPTGADEEKVASVTKDNPSRGMNALLARCLVGLGEMPAERREALGSKILSDLTMGDRGRIERAFRKEMPGVDLTQEIECESCGRCFRASLDLTGFFSTQ